MGAIHLDLALLPLVRKWRLGGVLSKDSDWNPLGFPPKLKLLIFLLRSAAPKRAGKRGDPKEIILRMPDMLTALRAMGEKKL